MIYHSNEYKNMIQTNFSFTKSEKKCIHLKKLEMRMKILNSYYII